MTIRKRVRKLFKNQRFLRWTALVLFVALLAQSVNWYIAYRAWKDAADSPIFIEIPDRTGMMGWPCQWQAFTDRCHFAA